MASTLGDAAVDVWCDSSATVTIRMTKGKKTSKNVVQKAFQANKKKWKVINFKKESRRRSNGQYTVKISGST